MRNLPGGRAAHIALDARMLADEFSAMAEPLKNRYGPEIPRRIAGMIAAAHPGFDRDAFLRDALAGYEALELMPRGRHIARALRAHLPQAYPEALRILVASLGPELPEVGESQGLAPFLYLPHTRFVEDHGLDHPDLSLDALHALTRRFTGEFAIRPFLQNHPAITLARLDRWVTDPSSHVRRLVSEGTRPRLPWAARLPDFIRDPAPTLPLLERLRDDPSDYVRRSVANHLNDIAKDHPDLVIDLARRWLADAPATRARLVRHALRTLVKAGHPGALSALGFGEKSPVRLVSRDISPASARRGDTVTITATLRNPAARPAPVLADLRIRFARTGGADSPKVFKLKSFTLPPSGEITLVKRYAFTDKTTRRHHPGPHPVDLLINGDPHPLGTIAYRG